MNPSDNVFYFGNDVDIRVCLKNAYTTVRTAWTILNHNDWFNRRRAVTNKIDHFGCGGQDERYRFAMSKQDIWDQPFRRGSYRIAIKRDPLERFKSTVSYLTSVKLHENYERHKKPYIDLTYVNEDDIDFVLDAFDKSLLRDEHFFSQTYFMGSVKNYDKIYDISEVGELLDFLQYKFAPEFDLRQLHQNKSDRAKIQLTSEQELRIIKMYSKDYANGWY